MPCLPVVTYPGDDAHVFQRIRQLSATINATDVDESSRIAARPSGVWMDTIKQVRQNPFQPAHIFSRGEGCRLVSTAIEQEIAGSSPVAPPQCRALLPPLGFGGGPLQPNQSEPLAANCGGHLRIQTVVDQETL